MDSYDPLEGHEEGAWNGLFQTEEDEDEDKDEDRSPTPWDDPEERETKPQRPEETKPEGPDEKKNSARGGAIPNPDNQQKARHRHAVGR